MTQIMTREKILQYLQWNAKRKNLPYKHIQWNELKPAVRVGKQVYIGDIGDAHADILYDNKLPYDDDTFEHDRGFMYKNKYYTRNRLYHSVYDRPLESNDLWWKPKGSAKLYEK